MDFELIVVLCAIFFIALFAVSGSVFSLLVALIFMGLQQAAKCSRH